jgi:hypothetical protein
MPLAGVTPYGTAGGPARPGPRNTGGGNFNAGGFYPQTGSKSLDVAVRGAKTFKDALGLPDYEDILGKLGGGQGTREFGNAGRAGTAADEIKGRLDTTRGSLAEQQRNIAMARGGIRNPTRTSGFKNIMRLTNERLGQAAEGERRAAADAVSRRGYVGGYSGERNDIERREALATSGYEAAGKEREAQQALFGGEADLYGSMLGGYGQELGAYTDLTKTAAELPTKWLDAYSGLLSGLGGGYGDIFGTALKATMFDEGNRREDVSNNRRPIQDARNRLRSGLGIAGQA